MTSEQLFNRFIPPKNFYTPKQISGYAPGTLPEFRAQVESRFSDQPVFDQSDIRFYPIYRQTFGVRMMLA